jgi:hypothetical protein
MDHTDIQSAREKLKIEIPGKVQGAIETLSSWPLRAISGSENRPPQAAGPTELRLGQGTVANYSQGASIKCRNVRAGCYSR